MKKFVIFGVLTASLFAGSCDEWYKKMQAKYHIVGTKTGIVMDKDGNWERIFAKGTASVDFDDEDEYEDALMEAEAKAKANIAHFLKEEVSSDKFINSLSKKIKESSSDGQKQSVKINKKKLKVTGTAIRNSASSLLKGVLVLCNSIDSKNKKAVVVVGVSPKTQKAADSARHGMYRDHATGKRMTESGNKATSNYSNINIKDSMDASESLDF